MLLRRNSVLKASALSSYVLHTAAACSDMRTAKQSTNTEWLLLLLLLHPFNGLFSRTTWLSWYQKGETSLNLNDGVLRWQCHQLDWTVCKESGWWKTNNNKYDCQRHKWPYKYEQCHVYSQCRRLITDFLRLLMLTTAGTVAEIAVAKWLACLTAVREDPNSNDTVGGCLSRQRLQYAAFGTGCTGRYCSA